MRLVEFGRADQHMQSLYAALDFLFRGEITQYYPKGKHPIRDLHTETAGPRRATFLYDTVCGTSGYNSETHPGIGFSKKLLHLIKTQRPYQDFTLSLSRARSRQAGRELLALKPGVVNVGVNLLDRVVIVENELQPRKGRLFLALESEAHGIISPHAVKWPPVERRFDGFRTLRQIKSLLARYQSVYGKHFKLKREHIAALIRITEKGYRFTDGVLTTLVTNKDHFEKLIEVWDRMEKAFLPIEDSTDNRIPIAGAVHLGLVATRHFCYAEGTIVCETEDPVIITRANVMALKSELDSEEIFPSLPKIDRTFADTIPATNFLTYGNISA